MTSCFVFLNFFSLCCELLYSIANLLFKVSFITVEALLSPGEAYLLFAALRPISTEKKVSEMRKMFALLMRTKISQFRSEEISLRHRVEVKSTFFAFRFRMMQSSQ